MEDSRAALPTSPRSFSTVPRACQERSAVGTLLAPPKRCLPLKELTAVVDKLHAPVKGVDRVLASRRLDSWEEYEDLPRHILLPYQPRAREVGCCHPVPRPVLAVTISLLACGVVAVLMIAVSGPSALPGVPGMCVEGSVGTIDDARRCNRSSAVGAGTASRGNSSGGEIAAAPLLEPEPSSRKLGSSSRGRRAGHLRPSAGRRGKASTNSHTAKRDIVPAGWALVAFVLMVGFAQLMVLSVMCTPFYD